MTENLEKSMEDLYLNGQGELLSKGLNKVIENENKKLNENKYSNVHFRNIHVYHLDSLAIDITSHSKVPKHEIIRKQPTINNILEKCNARINQFPIILRKDAMAKILRLAPGDICKITRNSERCGEYVYYRICQ